MARGSHDKEVEEPCAAPELRVSDQPYVDQESRFGHPRSSAIMPSKRADTAKEHPIPKGGNMVSPMWMSFTVSEQNHRIVTCKTCAATFPRWGQKRASFYTIKLLNHLKGCHGVEIRREGQEKVRPSLLCWHKERFRQTNFALHNSKLVWVRTIAPPTSDPQFETKHL